MYLEMFGHDMSWAAFHVLEVMSSAKYLQKRIGYLGAVQSFRPDTEVLMLATNLLKKVGSSAWLNTGLTTNRLAGLDSNVSYHDVPPDHNSTAHHYIFSGNVSAL